MLKVMQLATVKTIWVSQPAKRVGEKTTTRAKIQVNVKREKLAGDEKNLSS
jgi:hypothetical protein